jgi:hypothetical protein
MWACFHWILSVLVVVVASCTREPLSLVSQSVARRAESNSKDTIINSIGGSTPTVKWNSATSRPTFQGVSDVLLGTKRTGKTLECCGSLEVVQRQKSRHCQYGRRQAGQEKAQEAQERGSVQKAEEPPKHDMRSWTGWRLWRSHAGLVLSRQLLSYSTKAEAEREHVSQKFVFPAGVCWRTSCGRQAIGSADQRWMP